MTSSTPYTAIRYERRSILFGLLIVVAMSIFQSTPSAFAQTGGEPELDTIDIYLPGTGSGAYVDSVWFDGELIRLTVRIRDDIRRDTLRLRALLDSIETATYTTLARNLTFDPSEWAMTNSDRANREQELAVVQDRDWIYGSDRTMIPLFSIPLSSIGQALGLVEDVSPRLRFSILKQRDIVITVYSQSAHKIVTLMKGNQVAGDYTLEWDFLDSNGRRVLIGSYFAEVVADGTELILRKRIVAP